MNKKSLVVIVASLLVLIFCGLLIYSKSPREGDRRLISEECIKKSKSELEKNWCYEIWRNGEWKTVQ